VPEGQTRVTKSLQIHSNLSDTSREGTFGRELAKSPAVVLCLGNSVDPLRARPTATFGAVTNRAGLETKERILAATRSLLARGGLEAATVSAICRDAGVLPGSFYNLFESKEQAVLTVVREAIAAVDPEPAGRATVVDLVEAYVSFVGDQATLARVYLIVAVSGGLTDPGIRGRVLRHHQRRLERFQRALNQERPDLTNGEAERQAEAILAALNGYALHSLLDPAFDMAAHARRLVGTVLA